MACKSPDRRLTTEEVKRRKCSRCGARPGYSQWDLCADGNRSRVLCWPCDFDLNKMVLRWVGDRDWARKMTAYWNAWAATQIGLEENKKLGRLVKKAWKRVVHAEAVKKRVSRPGVAMGRLPQGGPRLPRRVAPVQLPPGKATPAGRPRRGR